MTIFEFIGGITTLIGSKPQKHTKEVFFAFRKKPFSIPSSVRLLIGEMINQNVRAFRGLVPAQKPEKLREASI